MSMMRVETVENACCPGHLAHGNVMKLFAMASPVLVRKTVGNVLVTLPATTSKPHSHKMLERTRTYGGRSVLSGNEIVATFS
jgi:hypothetical protein